MLTEEKLYSQYGKENVQITKSFSNHSKNLPPKGFAVKVSRSDFIRAPIPFNSEELMTGLSLFDIPESFKDPLEAPAVNRLLFENLDGSSIHLVSNMVPDASGHHLKPTRVLVVRAGVPKLASQACNEIELGLMAEPPKDVTWGDFFVNSGIAKLRDAAKEARLNIAREYLVSSGMCSKKEASSIKASDDITTHDIAVDMNDPKHFYVCSDVVMPFALNRSMAFYEGPLLGFRIFSGKPDSTLYGKGFTVQSNTAIPASFGLKATDKFGKTPFKQPVGDGKSVYHYTDAYKPFNNAVISEIQNNGRNSLWPETILRPVTVHII